MNDDTQTYDEESLRDELRQAREKLDHLVGDLRSIDRELESLDTERQQYRLLQDVCSGLDQLEVMGASELFWGNQDGGGTTADHLRLVRSRIDEFEKRLEEIEERRQSIFDEIQLQEDSTDLIAGDILEAERLEEQKKLEWEIERDVDAIPVRVSVMPWATGGEDDRRFRKALAATLLFSLVFSLLLPLIDIPIPERWQVLEEQERLTRLLREELPPPPVVEVKEAVPTKKDEPEPNSEEEAPLLAEELVPEAAPAAKPAEKPSPESKGILAFREKFAGLANDQAVARLGSNARISNAGESPSGLAERSMVTSQAPSASGGINVAALSRDTGGTGQALSGVAVGQATSSIGTGGGSDRPLAGGGPGLGRTDEEIQIVFDRHKAALYRLYNRELRKNPTLKGQIVLRMTIEPDGSVSLCEVKSSDMKSPTLSKQVVTRVKTFDFGAKDGISAVTIVYPIDFLPAT
jgi:outer membrane biosynthesis protein TonB